MFWDGVYWPKERGNSPRRSCGTTTFQFPVIHGQNAPVMTQHDQLQQFLATVMGSEGWHMHLEPVWGAESRAKSCCHPLFWGCKPLVQWLDIHQTSPLGPNHPKWSCLNMTPKLQRTTINRQIDFCHWAAPAYLFAAANPCEAFQPGSEMGGKPGGKPEVALHRSGYPKSWTRDRKPPHPKRLLFY